MEAHLEDLDLTAIEARLEALHRKLKAMEARNESHSIPGFSIHLMVMEVEALIWNLTAMEARNESHSIPDESIKSIMTLQAPTYDGGGRSESIEKIPEEEAICRFCYDTFKGENVVMLTCKCKKNTLAHESCNEQNNKNCDWCEQELQKL